MFFTFISLVFSLKSSLKPLEEEQISLPISIPVVNMTINGEKSCKISNACPTDAIISEKPCGQQCYSSGNHLITYEYTFKGEQFQVYGTYGPENHEYDIYLDNAIIATINQNTESETEYALQYTSYTFPYGQHTVKIAGKGQQFEFYKITYWPSVKAIRVNSTQISKAWVIESDKFGGIREWANQNSKNNDEKVLTIPCSKFWIVGSLDPGHGNLQLTIDGQTENIDTKSTNKRYDYAILKESDYLPFEEHEIKLKFGTSGVCINCIYYLPIAEPRPTPEPVSIPISAMVVSGTKTCKVEPNHACPGNQYEDTVPDTILTEPCGEFCESTDAAMYYQYTFEGEKFDVYGTYGPDFHQYDIFLDGERIATVDQNKNERSVYKLQYTSFIMQNGQHVVKIAGKGQKFEFYKIAYWPSIDAIRLNSTQILPLWKVEDDHFGGIREWANPNQKGDVVKVATIPCIKLWIIGSTDPNHGILQLTIDGELHEINTRQTPRVDYTVLHDTDLLLPQDHEIKLKHGTNGVCVNCIFYQPIPTPIPEALPKTFPVSVPVKLMKASNNEYDCSPDSGHECPSDLTILDTPCGDRCWSKGNHNIAYEYTFYGEKFQVYGTYKSGHYPFDVYLDNILLQTVNQTRTETIEYSLQFTSHTFRYGEHTVKLAGKGNPFEIYKISYWPSVKANRFNITEFTQEWNKQADTFGGIAEWANKGNKDGIAKEKNLLCSKIWVIGAKDEGHGYLDVFIDGERKPVYTKADSRINFSLLYQSDYLTLQDHTIKLKYGQDNTQANGILVNCIYYLTIPEPTPIPNIADIPISVPMKELTVVGSGNMCSKVECTSDTSSPCGYSCTSTGDHKISYEYLFTGVLVQIYGSYGSELHRYAILIDNVYVATVNQNSETSKLHELQFTSDILSFGTHKIKIVGIGEKYEIYKVAYWPSLEAKRLNASEFLSEGNWVTESDEFGGTRLVGNSAGLITKYPFHVTKFFIYGLKGDGYGSCKVTYGDLDDSFNAKLQTDMEFTLIFESPLLTDRTDNIVITTQGKTAINCIYYIGDIPLPTLTQTPNPSETPGPSETPLPSPTEKPPEIIIVNPEDLITDTKRYSKVANEHESVIVIINVSNFDSIHHNDDGGSIYIINSEFQCENVEFYDCTSEKAGGAIYINNTHDIVNNIKLEKLKFDQCKADYGGAVYVYSPNKENKVSIKNCEFKNNVAHSTNDGTVNKLFGGSAIFLTSYNGIVIRNKFIGNQGSSSVMINTITDDNNDNNLLLEHHSIIISECYFEISQFADCGLFYVGGNKATTPELINCNFTGNLNKDAHYINGVNIVKDSSKLIIKHCQFDADVEKAFKLDIKNSFFKADLKSQVFKINSKEKSKKSPSFSLKMALVPSLALIIVVIFIIFKKNQNTEDNNDALLNQ